MTTLLVSDVFPPKTGGSGRWFWEISRRLPRESLVIAAGEDPRQDAFDRTHDLRVVRTPLGMPSRTLTRPRDVANYFRGIEALLALVRSENIARIVGGRCLPEGLMARVLGWWTGLPYAVFAHGEDVNLVAARTKMDCPPGGGMLESRQYRWLTRWVLRGASFVIANCRNTRRMLIEDWGLQAERVRLLNPGVDTRRFVPVPRCEEVRARLGWGARPVVLTTSRLTKRKGQDRMIRALPIIRQAVPDVLYAVVGDGEERPALEQLTGQLGLRNHVQFLGEADEQSLVECYQQCDVFVLPNRQMGTDVEGFGMVLLEAQACGKPVVAGASGGTAETMQVPDTGLTVTSEGFDELGRIVVDLLGNAPQRAQMGAAGREWVVARFDWEPLSRLAAQMFELDVKPGAMPSSSFPSSLSGRKTCVGRSRLA